MRSEKLLVVVIILLIISAAGYFTFTKFKSEVINPTPSPTPSPALNFLITQTPSPIVQTGVQTEAQTGQNKLPSQIQNPSKNPEPAFIKNKRLTQFPGILESEVLKNKGATILTKKGNIDILIYPEATKTASNFLLLASNGFYDNLTFHRVERGFVIQGGDPNGDGTGGPGYTFEDEPVIGDYLKGTVAMANYGPNTNGSQFFIMLEDQLELPKKYTIFGKVVNGMNVVGRIEVGDVMEKVIIQNIQ